MDDLFDKKARKRRRGAGVGTKSGALRGGKNFTKSGGKDKVKVMRGKQSGHYGQTSKKPEPDMRTAPTQPKLSAAKRKRLESVNL